MVFAVGYGSRLRHAPSKGIETNLAEIEGFCIYRRSGNVVGAPRILHSLFFRLRCEMFGRTFFGCEIDIFLLFKDLNIIKQKEQQKMLSHTMLDALASALGDLARGCKKLRAVALKMKETRVPGEVTPPTAESETSESDSSTEEEDEKMSVLNDDYEKRVDLYFGWDKKNPGKKGGVISMEKDNTIKAFVKFCLDGRLRQDKYRNSWVYTSGDKESRRSWRKISCSQAQKLYSEIRNAWEYFQTKYEVKKKPGHIHSSKWNRRHVLTGIRLPENLWDCKPFLKTTKNLHDELPAFR